MQSNITNIAKYKLVFYHDVPKGGVFHEGEELYFHSADGSKYSVLGSLSDKYKIDVYYEFFLKYDQENNSPVYLHWKQNQDKKMLVINQYLLIH